MVLTLAIALVVASCAASVQLDGFSDMGGRDSSHFISPLTIIESPTPPFRVAGFDTSGSYPQASGGAIDLHAVNTALREAVIANQDAPAARTERKALSLDHPPVGRWRGLYRTELDTDLVSASTVIVSALLRVKQAVARYRLRGFEWLGINVRVPSGKPLTISELFASARGLRAFGDAWRATLRRQGAGECLDSNAYAFYFATSASNFQQFALTPRGLAVGVNGAGVCSGPWVATVRYTVLRPYLSRLGARLIAGVRRPRLAHLRRLRGAAVVSVQALPDGQELEASLRNIVPVWGALGLRVTVAAGGVRRSHTRIKVTLRQAHRTIVKIATIESIASGREKSAVFSSLGPLEFGAAVSLRVDVASLRGGRMNMEDHVVYSLTFRRGDQQEGEHGLALVVTKALPIKQALSTGAENDVPATVDLGFAVTIENTGRSRERGVRLVLSIHQAPSPIVETKTIDLIDPRQRRTAVFRVPVGQVQLATPNRLRVVVSPVSGERDTANNSATYRVVFTV